MMGNVVYELRDEKNGGEFWPWSDTDWPVQSQKKKARSLKLWI